jgi:hypothetical protein
MDCTWRKATRFEMVLTLPRVRLGRLLEDITLESTFEQIPDEKSPQQDVSGHEPNSPHLFDLLRHHA